MKNIKALNGTVIIRLKHTMQDQTPSGLYKDISYDRHGKMMISAECVEVSKKGTHEIMFELDRGAPRSKEVDPVYKLNRDVKHNIKTGDIVYFHYLVLESSDNFLFVEGEWKYYKCQINDIFLSIRKHTGGGYWRKNIEYRVVLHNEYVLGKKYFGEGWEQIEVDGRAIAGKVDKKSGLVTKLKGKPELNHATITDIGRGIDPYSRNKEVKPGDVALLKPKCEFVNEIENQERWVFTHSDIIAIYKGSNLIPVCDYVLIKLRDRTYEGKLEVDIEKLPLLDEGWVVSCGAKADDELFSKGMEVKFFSHKATAVLDDTHALVQECNIMGILNYSL